MLVGGRRWRNVVGGLTKPRIHHNANLGATDEEIGCQPPYLRRHPEEPALLKEEPVEGQEVKVHADRGDEDGGSKCPESIATWLVFGSPAHHGDAQPGDVNAHLAIGGVRQ